MNRRIHALIVATTLSCVFSWTIPSTFADSQSDLVNQQKQIRNATDNATADLNALILEFERNGLGEGADVQILKGIRNALANLSQKDMEKVIVLLEKARKDPKEATRALADAFTGQKGISVQLNELLIQYQHEQDLADVAMRLTRLADSENQNMRSGTALYRSSKGASPRTYNDVQKAQVQVQQSEQQSIYAQAKVLLERLQTLASQADATTAEHLKAVLAGAEKEKLIALSSGAADDLHGSNIFSAVGKQRQARDVLRDLARLAAPAKEPEDVLKEAASQLAEAIRDQNYIKQQAKAVTTPDKDGSDTVAKLDDRAADDVDIADSVRKDVAGLTPDAIPDLKKAQDTIQNARKDLADGKGKEAADQSAIAAQQLTEARQKLLDQIARIEEQKAADTKIAKAKALLEQVIALRKSQEQMQKETTDSKDNKTLTELTPRQAAMATNAQDLERTAALDVAIVAPLLANAAKDMDDAHTALGTTQSAPEAVKVQQLAIVELKKAEQMLAAEIATLMKKKEDLAKLEKARDQVAQMIKDQAKTEQETNKQAAADNQKKADDPAPRELARQEEKIAETAKDTAKDITEEAPEAAKSLTDAAKNADDAKNDLNKPDARAALPDAKQAAKNLDNAKQDLDNKIAQLKKDLDEMNDDAAKLADADKKIEEAQQDIANSEMPDPIAQLHDTQKKIADDLKKLPQDQPAVKEATKAAEQAADDLAKNDLDKAGENMQKAQDAMKKAEDPAAKIADAAKKALPDLDKRQEDARKELAAMKPRDPADALADAGQEAADAMAEDGEALPEDANAALADAKDALSDAAAAKAAGKPDNGKTDKAKGALARAKAAVAMAQAGLGTGKPGKMPGQEPGNEPGPVDENNATLGKGNRIDNAVNASSQTGPRARITGASGYAGLPPRDRDAIQQSRAEKYPEEYGPMIEQYLKNLSDKNGR